MINAIIDSVVDSSSNVIGGFFLDSFNYLSTIPVIDVFIYFLVNFYHYMDIL